MLTQVEAISLAGDRAKQNDDACGTLDRCAWVIDGATDLDAPLSDAASDAAWIAESLTLAFYDGAAGLAGEGGDSAELREIVRAASLNAAQDFSQFGSPPQAQRWRLPTASVVAISDHEGDLIGLELGDCRCFALDANGAAHILGGAPHAADDERRAAAHAAKTADPAALLRDPNTMSALRAKRAQHNTPDGYWVFGLQPDCAEHARSWRATLTRPAHILLCTDGFSALVDRYAAYDAGGLVRAALDKGLQELGRELRAIEAADASGAQHPRFKPSDDATALLLRLS